MSIANSLELGMLALVNEARAEAGLSPLRLITNLNDAAESHSNWMLNTDTFSHEGAEGSSTSDRMDAAGYRLEGNSVALENIGWQSARGGQGYADDVAQIHDSLMASPGHRANILNPDIEDIGIGIETGPLSTPEGDFEAVMVTQVFGATDADVSAFVDPGTGTDDATIDPDLVASGAEDTAEDVDSPDLGTDLADERSESEPMDATLEAPTDTEELSLETEGQDADEDMRDLAGSDMDMPCGMGHFTLDLSSAFDMRRDGDQIIWETTEDRLIDAFLQAFNTRVGVPDDVDGDVIDLVADTPEDASEDEATGLLLEDLPTVPVEDTGDTGNEDTEEEDALAYA